MGQDKIESDKRGSGDMRIDQIIWNQILDKIIGLYRIASYDTR